MWERTHVHELGEASPPVPCAKCGRPTVHLVLARHTEHGPGAQSAHHVGVVEDAWTICRCEECGTVAFLRRSWSSSNEYTMLVPMETWSGFGEAWRWDFVRGEGGPTIAPDLPQPVTRIMEWNIRHGGGRRVKEILARIARHRPDVVVLTEYRDDKPGQELRMGLMDIGLSYARTVEPPEKANGLLIAAHAPFDEVRPLAPGLEKPHMLIEAMVAGIALVGVYMPLNAAKTPYWEAVVAAAKERSGQPTLFIGDFNTGKHYIDEQGATLVSASYMDRMEDAGFIDLWRARNPDGREFTWTSNAGNGFRLDHAFASPSLAERLIDVWYSHAERSDRISDHSAMILDIALVGTTP